MALSILLSVSLAASGPIELPYGWRYPTASELTDAARSESPAKYAKVVADLNGDGTDDTAVLLKSTVHSAEALWVHLSSAKGAPIWTKVDEIRWDTTPVELMMGIEIQQPGGIAYACFDDANDCDFGPYSLRPKLRLSSPSLVYFKLGSAASLIFWSNSQEKFLRVWLSD